MPGFPSVSPLAMMRPPITETFLKKCSFCWARSVLSSVSQNGWPARVDGTRLPARTILITLLESLASIWPGRIALGGHNLGDVGRHPAARTDDPTDGLVPLHKLSQWLAYSLTEPLEDAGIEGVDLDALTALAEYRNGGLLIDSGVLVPKHAAVLGEIVSGLASRTV